MGFGLICAGLLTLLFLRIIPAELVGFAAISKGLGMLKGYNSFFRAALYSSYALIAFSAVDAVIWVLKIAGVMQDILWLESLLSYLHLFLLIPFQMFLFRGLSALSKELGYDKGVKRSSLALAVMGAFCLVTVLSLAGISVFGTAGMLMELANIAFCEFAVYTCYKGITTDEAEKREEEKIEKFQKQFSRGKKKK